MNSRSLKAQGNGITHPELTGSLLRKSWASLYGLPCIVTKPLTSLTETNTSECIGTIEPCFS